MLGTPFETGLPLEFTGPAAMWVLASVAQSPESPCSMQDHMASQALVSSSRLLTALALDALMLTSLGGLYVEPSCREKAQQDGTQL